MRRGYKQTLLFTFNNTRTMATKGTLKYRIYPMKDSRKPDEDAKFYARAVQDRTVDFEALVSHMAEHNSPYSRGVISGVLTDMLDCVKELVLDGKAVRLGDLGLFSVGLKSGGALTVEDFKPATHIKGVNLNVRNTKTWSNTELRKLCTITELDEYKAGVKAKAEDSSEPEGEEGAAD